MLRWLQAAPRLAAARYATAADAAELRVAVVGLGAIGSTVFAKLARLAASDARAVGAVTAVARSRQLSEWLSGERARLTLTANDASPGVSVELEFERAGRAAVAVGAPNVTVRTLEGELPEDERFDVVLLAVKAYDSSAAIRELQRAERLVKRDAVCVLLQNGLGEGLPGPEEREQTAWSFMNGVTFIGGRVEAFGRVVTSGAESGVTYLAPVGDSHDASKADALAALLRAAGLRCEVLTTGEMQAILWRKLIVNAGINPIASLLDGPNKVVGACEWSRRCVAMVVAEAFAVAQAEQVPLDCSEQELVDEVLRVAINTGSNTCSMLADLRRGSRTEIDAISGRIVALGRRHGVATPANELLLSLVKARERASA